MRAYLVSQLAQGLLVVLGVSIVTFTLMRLTGDPLSVMLPLNATPEMRAQFSHDYGLDQPILVQYLDWMGAALHGDFGTSLFARSPALPLVLERMPATMLLGLSGIVLAVVIAIPLGMLAGVHPRSGWDNLVTTLAVSGNAVPIYWLGLMLIVLFAVQWRLLPASGYGSVQNLILPMITLAVFLAPVTVRLIRSGMLDVLAQDYIRTARSRGLSEQQVMIRHALRNVAVPVVTVVGLQTARLMGGTVITETVFAWPGVGNLVVTSVFNRDFPVVQAAVFILALFVVLLNIVVDLLVAWVDPRVRLRG
jgi:peptide/nickel transport system permease protein